MLLFIHWCLFNYEVIVLQLQDVTSDFWFLVANKDVVWCIEFLFFFEKIEKF